jgi:hypothetical protein
MKPDPPVAGGEIPTMDKASALKLPDELYEVFRRQAASGGRTADELAAEWIERNGPRPPRRPDDPARNAALEQLRRHAGAVDSGDPRSADNAAIDADLAREAAGQPGSPEGSA